MTAVLLALGSALAYGCSDFVGGLVARRSSAWAVAVLAQCSSALCTAAVALRVDGAPRPADLAWAALAGTGTGVGTAFLYRGLSRGRMAVVAPVSAVGAAVVPVLAGGMTGERLPVLTWLGVLAALPAIALVSRTPGAGRTSRGPRRALPEGLLDGLLAGAGFGLLFVALGQVPASAGWWPLTLCQVVSVPSVVLLAAALRADWVPRGRPVLWALLGGPLSAGATGLFLLSTQHGYLSVAGVVASLYPASTVVLAALVLREKVHAVQGVGLALCAVAVGLVALG